MRLLREKRFRGRPYRRKSAEEAPGPPAESECLEWNSNFYTYSKKLQTRRVLFLKTKLIGAGVREPCGKSVPKGTKIAQFSNHFNDQIVILFFHFKGFYHLP
ncbi:hypothetical protein CMV16_15290 [Peribacillus simplex]|nr:hypothetical protein CMV16_15290 [Peribacillus simplex]